MKILYILPEEYNGERWGGVTSYVLQMAKDVYDKHHSVTVITPGQKDTVNTYHGVLIRALASIKHTNILIKIIFSIVRRVAPSILYRINWAITVREYIQKTGPYQIIESPEWGSSTLFLSPWKYTVVIRLHRSWLMYLEDNALPIKFEDRVTDIFERICILKATAVTSPTQFMLDQYPIIVYILKRLQRIIKLIPYGIARELQTVTKSKTKTIRKPYILTVGRVEIAKGSVLLAEAFIEICKKNQSLNLVFVGEDTTMYIRSKFISCITYIRKLLLKHQLTNRVFFIPRQDRSALASFYQSSLFYVIPSIGKENLSLSLLEAITNGKAVVGSNTGGTPECVYEGKNGLLFETNNYKDLASKITYMYKHPKDRLNFEKNSRILRVKYSSETITNISLQLYKRIMSYGI